MKGYTVKDNRDGTWRVVCPSGDVIADKITNRAAWLLADEMNGEPTSPSEQFVDDCFRKDAAGLH